MANRILLQTLLRFSDDIKSGAAKVQDVVTDYFNQTGKSVTDEERGIILKEFQDNAPSNVVEDVFTKAEGIDSTSLKDNLMETDNPFSDLVKTTEEGPKTLDQRRADAIKELGSDRPVTGKINYPLIEKQLGVKLRGNETFDELLEIEKNTKESRQGLGSLFPKGQTDSIFDQKNSNRMEVAAFMRAMREAGIKNEDVMSVIKDKTDFKRQPAFDYFGSDKPKEVVELAEGKRAATTLARAADMAADSKVKQELLANLDDDIANYGPDWWKGMGYNDGPMGRESVGNLLESMTTDINNGVIDDLVAQGVDEDKAFEVMRAFNREALKFDPKAFIRKTAEELEFNDIKYDMTFWDNYVDEILTRIQKPEPRFAHGGLV
jgi:hypothetical protein